MDFEESREEEEEHVLTAQARVRQRLLACTAPPAVPLKRDSSGSVSVDLQALRRRCPAMTELREVGDQRRLTPDDIGRACDARDRRQHHKQLVRCSSAPGLRQEPAQRAQARALVAARMQIPSGASTAAPIKDALQGQSARCGERFSAPAVLLEAFAAPEPEQGWTGGGRKAARGRSAGSRRGASAASFALGAAAGLAAGCGGPVRPPPTPPAAVDGLQAMPCGPAGPAVGASWHSVLNLVQATRAILRWWRKRKAQKVVIDFLHSAHFHLFFEVRRGYRRHCAASRQVQSAWRGFSSRVDCFVEALVEGPWRELEFRLLDMIFTACPYDEDVVVSNLDFLCGDGGEDEDGAGRPRHWKGRVHRTKAVAELVDFRRKQIPQRPKSAIHPRDVQRKRQDEDLQLVIATQVRRRVLQRARAHRLRRSVACKLLRREIVERLYERVGYASEESSFPEPQRSTAPCVLRLTAAGRRAAESFPTRLAATMPAAAQLLLEDVAEVLLCAHRVFGPRPVKMEHVALSFRGCPAWRLAAMQGHVTTSRTIREGLVDRWSVRWSLWKPLTPNGAKPPGSSSGATTTGGSRSSSKCSSIVPSPIRTLSRVSSGLEGQKPARLAELRVSRSSSAAELSKLKKAEVAPGCAQLLGISQGSGPGLCRWLE